MDGRRSSPGHVDEEPIWPPKRSRHWTAFDCSPLALAALNAPAGRWAGLVSEEGRHGAMVATPPAMVGRFTGGCRRGSGLVQPARGYAGRARRPCHPGQSGRSQESGCRSATGAEHGARGYDGGGGPVRRGVVAADPPIRPSPPCSSKTAQGNCLARPSQPAGVGLSTSSGSKICDATAPALSARRMPRPALLHSPGLTLVVEPTQLACHKARRRSARRCFSQEWTA